MINYIIKKKQINLISWKQITLIILFKIKFLRTRKCSLCFLYHIFNYLVRWFVKILFLIFDFCFSETENMVTCFFHISFEHQSTQELAFIADSVWINTKPNFNDNGRTLPADVYIVLHGSLGGEKNLKFCRQRNAHRCILWYKVRVQTIWSLHFQNLLGGISSLPKLFIDPE